MVVIQRPSLSGGEVTVQQPQMGWTAMHQADDGHRLTAGLRGDGSPFGSSMRRRQGLVQQPPLLQLLPGVAGWWMKWPAADGWERIRQKRMALRVQYGQEGGEGVGG